jgi:hypothetical protein
MQAIYHARATENATFNSPRERWKAGVAKRAEPDSLPVLMRHLLTSRLTLLRAFAAGAFLRSGRGALLA